MKSFLRVTCVVGKLLLARAALLFGVYFFNLDQKLLDWLYARLTRERDRRQTDAAF